MQAAALLDIKDHVVVVTGAASGIGRAIAEVLAANGAKVIIADVDSGAAEQAALELRARDFHAVGEPVDVTDRHGLQKLMEGVVTRHGRLDVVFANAGISGGVGPANPAGQVTAIKPELWEQVLRVNLTGVLSTIQAAVPHMKARNYGRIIVTASAIGTRPDSQVGYPYIASKAAVVNLVRQAAVELAPHNILVNAMAPGPFRTSIGGKRPPDPARESAIASGTLLKRIADPREIMGLALLLASPASSYITGSIMVIDGGQAA
jgi:NAD(P)-dependent dehydrogenase (short-subunit alcohol dehydrogenase family)